ncbi:Sden_1168 family B12-binding radical SAM P-methyltransferase [Sorangium sp. So ce134]
MSNDRNVIRRLRLRDPALEKNLPVGSSLREYLAQKNETAALPLAAHGSPAYAPFRQRRDDWPRTILIAPPMCASEGSVKRVIPPLGLTYVAAALASAGIPCDLLDCVVEGVDREVYLGDRMWRYGLDFEAVRRRVEAGGYEIVGLSLLYSSDLGNLLECARAVKAIDPSIVVVVGGLHPSIYARELLSSSVVAGRPLIDFIIRGEGEIRFVEFLRDFRDGRLNLAADGLAGWYDGRLFVNPQISTIDDLDALPYPAYDRLPMDAYFAYNVPFSPFPRGKRVMQLYTSRGCPVGCTFCSSTNFSKAYRARSVDNVIREIESHVRTYGVDEIQFADDNLTFNRARSFELFDRLRALGLPWCTPNGIMVNTLSIELLDRMIDSGLYQITLSLDSANVRTLRELHRKPVKLQRVPELMGYLRARNVLIHGTLVVGMPGESLREIEESFRFVAGLPFDSVGVFIAQALPGSELYEKAIVSGAITPAEANRIDSARCQMRLSDVEPEALEAAVSRFLFDYNEAIRRRDPDAWERKYGAHRDRMRRICIGQAAPNTDAILRADVLSVPRSATSAAPSR